MENGKNIVIFKKRYNILVFLNTMFGILNYLLVLCIFGVSKESDAYLLAISSNFIIMALISFPFSQFMLFYQEQKNISINKSHCFYSQNIVLGAITGILFFILISVFMPHFAKIFAYSLDAERMELFKSLLQVLIISSAVYPVYNINEQFLNARMKFAFCYIMNAIPSLIVILAQIYMITTHNNNIYLLVKAYSIGYIIIAFLSSIYIIKTMCPFKFRGFTKDLFLQVKNSTVLRFADIFSSLSLQLIFNNYVAAAPKGVITYLHYGRKIADICYKVIMEPPNRILRSNISDLIVKKEVKRIKDISKKFLLLGTIVFLIGVFCFYIAQTPVLKLVAGNKLTLYDLNQIKYLFLSFCPWYLCVLVEFPFVTVVILSKVIKPIIYTNIVFCILLISGIYIFNPVFNIYSLGLSVCLAQLFNLIVFIFISKNILNRVNSEAKTISKNETQL